MSHLTTFKNNALVNTKKNLLEEGLKELGITLDYEDRVIRNSYITETVDAAMIVNGKRVAIGLNFVTNKDGEEEVVVAGDFYGTGLNQETLTNQIGQYYQKHNVINTCQNNGWTIDNENVVTNENGEIEVTAYRYA